MKTTALVASERIRLATELTKLTDAQWKRPSLCGAWNNHEVAAHLNVPFEIGTVGFVVGFAKAFGRFDVANERFARDLARRMGPEACIENLRANAEHRFTPPGFGPEAPLTDVLIHGGDILRPLDRVADSNAESLDVALRFITTPKAARAFGGAVHADLRYEPTDAAGPVGSGDLVVAGPGLSIIATLAGRTAYLDDLSGPGADLLRTRVGSAS